MTESLRDKRYKSDEVYGYMNQNFVSLKEQDIGRNNVHLDRVIRRLIAIMRIKDKLFDSTYERIAYAGSFYDDLKVGKPEEFDLDIVINLLVRDKRDLSFHPDESRPGYIKIRVDNMNKLRQNSEWITDYKSLDKWVNQEGFIYQDKFRRWMEGVVDKALNTLPWQNGHYLLEVDGCEYILYKKKSGPAHTLYIRVPEGYQIDVDLVPVLEFKCDTPEGFRPTYDYKKKSWLAVAKPLEGLDANILWRLSFYEQERDLIKGPVKPVIRQMKKMRDTQKFKNLASYYIKTLFLWEMELQKYNEEFSRMPRTCLFVHMLRKLCEACRKGCIYDFWCENQNLLSRLSPMEVENMYYRLTRLIQSIERNITDDQFIIARYILTDDEYKQMRDNYPQPVPAPSEITDDEYKQMSDNYPEPVAAPSDSKDDSYCSIL